MPSIIVDSGPLVALFDRDDRHHRRAIEFIRKNNSTLVTNLPVIGEVAFMLRASPTTQHAFLGWICEAADVDRSTLDDMPRIIWILAKYHDLPADFADASLVALADRLRITRVASIDSDFAVYRTPAGRAFRNMMPD